MSNPIFNFIDLHQGEEDKQKVLENVTANTSFRGSNLWILACAIIIASIGLNVNSTAVIIGAMLISPLMGPIVGAGLALGTYNFPLLKKSIKNLGIATLVSLLVSTVYFYLSPFKDVDSELLARTSPNIYDVMIAFFGGLVGVIAMTRVEKGNPIPGVAIATALMPPLCTAGYGLATFNFTYFFGAFYLYTINCFFICIATFVVIKYLKYPSSRIDEKHEKRIRYGISALVVIMIVPSFYLAYTLYSEKRFAKAVEQYINIEFNAKGYTVIYKKINYNESPKKIELALLDKKMTAKDIKRCNDLLKIHGLENTKLILRQDDADLKSEILGELNKRQSAVSEKDVTINNLRRELENSRVDDPGLVKEMEILFPQIKEVSIGKVKHYTQPDSGSTSVLLLYSADGKVDEERLRQWVGERVKTPATTVVKIAEQKKMETKPEPTVKKGKRKS